MCLREANLDVGALLKVHGVNEAHLALFEIHNQGMRADTVPEKAHAAEEIAVSNAGAGENDLASRGEIFGFVDALGIGDACP